VDRHLKQLVTDGTTSVFCEKFVEAFHIGLGKIERKGI